MCSLWKVFVRNLPAFTHLPLYALRDSAHQLVKSMTSRETRQWQNVGGGGGGGGIEEVVAVQEWQKNPAIVQLMLKEE